MSFNLGEYLTGANYPTAEVALHWDRLLSKQISELADKLADAETTTEATKIKKELTKLIRQRDETAIKVTIQGIPRQVKDSIQLVVNKEHPVNINNPNLVSLTERETALEELLLQSYITKIVDPNGNEQSPATLDSVRSLKGFLPETEFNKLNIAINEVENLTTGFELSTEDSLFL